jgi:predicted  nucleic acid-binding Zn-ribbon protein
MAKNTSKKIKELKGIKPEKIKDQELATLQASVRTVDQLTAEVGTIEVRKHALMKAMESVQQRIEQLRVQLRDEYGTDNINIADGVINYPEEAPKPEENGKADKKD